MTESASANYSVAREMRRDLLQIIKLVVIVLLVMLFTRTFVIENCPVEGPSMDPTLHDNDRILVYKLPTWLGKLPFGGIISPVEPGQLVVFQRKEEAGTRYIKRVIAKGPRILANVANATTAEGGPAANDTVVSFSHDGVFVNNRRIDEPYLDSEEREMPNPGGSIALGAGQYYVLGDHRSVSKDSRRFGPVNEDQILGRAVWRIWPLSKFGPL